MAGIKGRKKTDGRYRGQKTVNDEDGMARSINKGAVVGGKIHCHNRSQLIGLNTQMFALAWGAYLQYLCSFFAPQAVHIIIDQGAAAQFI